MATVGDSSLTDAATTVSLDPQTLFVETPLYEAIPLPSSMARYPADRIQFFVGSIDAYCPQCKSESVFRTYSVRPDGRLTAPNSMSPLEPHPRERLPVYDFRVELCCTRTQSHRMLFFFRVSPGEITKIGQFPSLADLQLAGVKDYVPILGKDRAAEFSKAIGLAAHGVGIGSFVYLRRIFESLVEDARATASRESEWDDAAFGRMRMSEKIGALSHFLPAFLVQNKTMYSILSLGLHELSEKDCLSAFPVVKVGIELILDEKLAQAEMQRKLQQASGAIGALSASIGGDKPTT